MSAVFGRIKIDIAVNQKERSKQRAEYLQKQDDILSQQNKAKARCALQADPEKKKASVRDSYNADIESSNLLKGSDIKRTSRRTRAAKRPKYEDNSAAIKASERNRYWYDPAVRLAKRAAEGGSGIAGVTETTTTPKVSSIASSKGCYKICPCSTTAARYIAAPLLSAASSSCSTAPAEQSCPPPLPPTANSRAAPTSSSRSRSTALRYLHPAPPPATVLAPVPHHHFRLLPTPGRLPPPTRMAPMARTGRRGHRRGWGRQRGHGGTVQNIKNSYTYNFY
eukprot:Em0002g1492a